MGRLPPRSELKTIFVPSGEKDGEVSIDGSDVSREDVRLFRFITKMSLLPPRST